MARLTNAEIENQEKELVQIVAAHAKPLTRTEIGEAFAKGDREISDRMLQRRLEALVRSGRLTKGGSTRAAIYGVPEKKTLELQTAEEGDSYVPLSRQGKRIRDSIRRPVAQRKPVGYEPSWLYRYQPGKTYYLSRSIRQRLHELGRTPDEQRPAGTYARDIFARLLIDLAWASSRLEGNTYTRLETQALLEFGQMAEGKDAEEAQMLLNHKAAIEYLVHEADQISFSRHTVRALHALLS